MTGFSFFFLKLLSSVRRPETESKSEKAKTKILLSKKGGSDRYFLRERQIQKRRSPRHAPPFFFLTSDRSKKKNKRQIQKRRSPRHAPQFFFLNKRQIKKRRSPRLTSEQEICHRTLKAHRLSKRTDRSPLPQSAYTPLCHRTLKAYRLCP